VIEAIEQSQLVDEDRPQGEALGVAEALGRDRAMNAEDALEVLVEERTDKPCSEGSSSPARS